MRAGGRGVVARQWSGGGGGGGGEKSAFLGRAF